jgi:transcriptional regulator with XRE-family HTH domain
MRKKPHNTYIPDLLALARNKTGAKSNYALAKAINVSQATVSNWHRGLNIPQGDPAVKLAEAVGIDGAALNLWGLAQRMHKQWPEAYKGVGAHLQRTIKKAQLVPARSGLDPWAHL